MRYGFVVPGYDIRTVGELAREAEEAGWDGFFVADGVYGIDPWVALTVVAVHTQRIRFGTMLTPASRRRPWKLASEVVTLDHLSDGRVILPVGLGAIDTGFDKVGEATDRKVRAQLLDEGLDVIAGLWSGQPFTYEGEHYHVRWDGVRWSVQPIQAPRIPIWVVGAWPRMKSMRRALRWDGIIPAKMNQDRSFAPITPDDIRAIKAFVDKHRVQTTPFDIVMEGETPGDDREKATATVSPLVEAGITWWIESMWWDDPPATPELVRRRIKQGPPGLDEETTL